MRRTWAVLAYLGACHQQTRLAITAWSWYGDKQAGSSFWHRLRATKTPSLRGSRGRIWLPRNRKGACRMGRGRYINKYMRWIDMLMRCGRPEGRCWLQEGMTRGGPENGPGYDFARRCRHRGWPMVIFGQRISSTRRLEAKKEQGIRTRASVAEAR